MTVAFLGLGGMGAAMATNLVKGGQEVVVWNRSPARTEPLVAAGAKAAATPAQAVRDATVAISMLADDAALFAVLEGDDGLLAGLPRGALHVSMSTIAVATAERVAAQHQERGQRYLSAPVFGRPDAAAAAKLFIVAAGAGADIDAAAPLFDLMGQKLFRIGDEPAHANLVKLCGNFTILAAIEAMAEAMALAAKAGVPKAKLYEVFTGTLFDAPVYRNYGKLIVDGSYRPAGFKAPLGLKDMRLAGESAERHRVPMPLLSLLRNHLVQTIAQEGEDIDWSGIGATVARNAGLKS